MKLPLAEVAAIQALIIETAIMLRWARVRAKA